MNFFKYIQTDAAAFWENYLKAGWIQVQHHQEFPLDIYNYTRATVHENKWDAVTSKCRGIIVNRDTGEIVARPFEKFHNYGSTTPVGESQAIPIGQPVVWEKMDGFMCTLYRYANKDYIASKGSFHSIHAKWATAQIRAKFGDRLPLLGGKTLVFEGLHRDLRIVIDYKERQELVLLAVIDNETGTEYSPESLEHVAMELGFNTPLNYELTLEQARAASLGDGKCDEEGYVLTWYRAGQPPFRLKMKFIEYLRLHRMVTGVSPKRIWEVLATKQTAELKEYLSQSTPWFSDFVQKWVRALNAEYERIYDHGNHVYNQAQAKVERTFPNGFVTLLQLQAGRRVFAETATAPENKEFSAIAFAMLDGKQIAPVIWKMVRHMTHGANPMVDAHNT
jgi:RNA ligase